MKIISCCAAAVLASFLNLSNANASTVTIQSQIYTGNAPAEGDATPVKTSGPSNSFMLGVSGSVSNVYLSPYANNKNGTANTKYNVIETGGSVTYDVFSNTYSILWGSPDNYNTISFYDMNGHLINFYNSTTQPSLTSVNGSNLACYTSSCDQQGFDLVTFSSTVEIGTVVLADTQQAAFEFGTVATPLPESIFLLGPGLLGLGLLSLRRRKNTSGLNVTAA